MTPSPDDLDTILFRATDQDVPLGASLTFDGGTVVRRATLTVGGSKVAILWSDFSRTGYLVDDIFLPKRDVIYAILCRIANNCRERRARETASAAKILDKIAESISPPEIIGRLDDLDDSKTTGTAGFAATHDDQTGDDDEIIYRSAPRWAWAAIDDLIAMEAHNASLNDNMRSRIDIAAKAVALSCARADDEPIGPEDVEAARFGPVQWTPNDIASLVMFGRKPGSRA